MEHGSDDVPFAGQKEKTMKSVATLFPQLTATEVEVCAYIVLGSKSWQTAKLMGVNEHTIENHRNHIRKKLKLEQTVSLRTFLLGMV